MVEAKLIVGCTGNVISFCVFLLPIPTFWSIFKKKSTQEFSGVLYVTTLLSCMFWVLYSLPWVTPDALPVLIINAAGIIAQCIYITAFLIYATKKGQIQVLSRFLIVIATVGSMAALTLTVIPHKRRTGPVGGICLVINVAMHGAPLSVVKRVLSTKSVRSLPLLHSISYFLNSGVWMVYGILADDLFIQIPNGLGAVFGICQLALQVIYHDSDDSHAPEKKHDTFAGNNDPVDLASEDGALLVQQLSMEVGATHKTSTHRTAEKDNDKVV